MADAPAFQTYPKDLFIRTAGFTNQELGIYVRLEGLCWLRGSLPKDLGELARLAQEPPKTFAKLWPALAPLFTERDGRLHLDHLDQQRAEHKAYSEQQAANARARWEKERAERERQEKERQAAQGRLPMPESHGNATADATALPPQSRGNALHTPYSVLPTPPSVPRTPSGGAGGADGPPSGRVPTAALVRRRDMTAGKLEPLGLVGLTEAELDRYWHVDISCVTALLERKKHDPTLTPEIVRAELERNLASQGRDREAVAQAARATPLAVSPEPAQAPTENQGLDKPDG